MKKVITTDEVVSTNPIQSNFHLALPDVRRVTEFFEFVHWCATASWNREPATQKEFAERFKLAEDTLVDWKRHQELWPLVWRIILERMKEQVPDVIEGLYGKIASGKGSAGDVQLFLRLAAGEPKPTDKNNNK